MKIERIDLPYDIVHGGVDFDADLFHCLNLVFNMLAVAKHENDLRASNFP